MRQDIFHKVHVECDFRLKELAAFEPLAQKQIPMYMRDWIKRLDAIIQLNGRELLTHVGTVSHQMTLEKSVLQYDKCWVKQRCIQYEENLKELEKDIKTLKDEL